MKTYITMLRGINVSGQKKIKMVDLKAHFEELGFQNVRTYIQSGNILFDYEDIAIKVLEQKVIDQIKLKYDFNVPTIIKLKEDIEYVLSNNPFLKRGEDDTKAMYVTFLSEEPEEAYVQKLAEMKLDGEEFVVDGKFVYLFVPGVGYGKTKLSNNLFENKLKVAATSRNWRTVNKLFEMTDT